MFVAVVGPSGAGKDTVIAAARERLGCGDRFRFARRYITRAAGSAGEPHVAVSEAEFERLVQDGRLALWWQAHGLRYGIPAAVSDWLADGRHVVCNLSRSVVREAAARFPRLHVAHVTAPPQVIAARLAQRGRESAPDIAARLQRSGSASWDGLASTQIVNDGPVERAAEHFITLLERFAAETAAPA